VNECECEYQSECVRVCVCVCARVFVCAWRPTHGEVNFKFPIHGVHKTVTAFHK